MVEANLGQLAQNNGSAQSVKDFAQQLTTDHTSDYGALATVAKQANLTMPTAIDAEHNKVMIDPFQKLTGTPFDRKYIQEMIAGHTNERVVAALSKYTRRPAVTADPVSAHAPILPCAACSVPR